MRRGGYAHAILRLTENCGDSGAHADFEGRASSSVAVQYENARGANREKRGDGRKHTVLYNAAVSCRIEATHSILCAFVRLVEFSRARELRL